MVAAVDIVGELVRVVVWLLTVRPMREVLEEDERCLVVVVCVVGREEGGGQRPNGQDSLSSAHFAVDQLGADASETARGTGPVSRKGGRGVETQSSCSSERRGDDKQQSSPSLSLTTLIVIAP